MVFSILVIDKLVKLIFFLISQAENLAWLSPIVFSLSGIISGICVFFLPETNQKPLMETIADLNHRLNCGCERRCHLKSDKMYQNSNFQSSEKEIEFKETV